MNIDNLQRIVIDALEDIKAQNILVFDAQPITSIFDRVVIVSGTSNRQTRALAKNLHDKVKTAGGWVNAIEGDETGEWILVDLGDIVVHIMQPAIRDYYRLEEIWGKYPIDWEKMHKGKRSAAKKSGKKSSSKTSGADTSGASGSQATKNKASASKTPVSKASKTSAAKKPVAKKSAAKNPASKTPTKKPAAKKVAAKKPAAKKSSGKK